MSNQLNELINFLDKAKDNSELTRMVPIEKWIEDPFFVGNISIWPYWKKKLIEFYNSDYTELILSGSTRGGKTFFTNLIIIRQLYELSVYKYQYGNINTKFGLDANSTINIIMLSTTIKQAEKNSFRPLRKMIDTIPYFKQFFPRNDNKNSTIEFDNGGVIVDVATSYFTSLLGANALMVILDEANMIGGGDSGYEDAMEIYAEASTRRKQTFSINSRTYGFNVLISSADTTQSFIETRIEEQASDPQTCIIKSKKFEVEPDRFSKDMFWMFAGDKNIEPFVIDIRHKGDYKDLLDYLNVEDPEVYLQYEDIKEVIIPDEHKDLFERAPVDFYKEANDVDILRVLKDVCGRSLGISGNFFNNIVAYKGCINNILNHPFFSEEIEVSTENTVDNELILNLRPEFKGDRNRLYTVSLDLSKRLDCTGLALGHWDIIKCKAVVDLMIRIKPPSNKMHKIRYDSIKNFILYLISERGFRITKFYCDGYQTEEFIQYFDERRIKSALLGIDRTDNQYVQFRNKILENAIEFYDYPIFYTELFSLVHDRQNRKVDHKTFGSKDVSDAVCRLVYSLFIDYGTQSSVLTPTIKRLIEMKKEEQIDKYSKEQVLKMENDFFHKETPEEIFKRKQRQKLSELL